MIKLSSNEKKKKRPPHKGNVISTKDKKVCRQNQCELGKKLVDKPERNDQKLSICSYWNMFFYSNQGICFPLGTQI